MIKPVEAPIESERLKRLLHEKIDRLSAGQLSLLNRVLLQLEAEELAENLDAAFDDDRNAGKLSDEGIQQVISGVRARRARQLPPIDILRR